MRAKGFFYLCLCSFIGITPAYAGKSKVDTAGVVFFRDHPRLCGEKVNCRVP